MTDIIGNRYQLTEKIGSGGMADVYLAFDTVLKRDVALKILHGNLSQDPVALLRFQREANAVSGLNHPNIVDVYDVGEDAKQHYIVMEFVRGITLKELINRRGALDKNEAVSIMLQLAKAVLKAHQSNIIHRDIKPQNILIKDDGTAKIADFGIALAEDALQLTKSDSVMGSVHYLAPECVRGEGASEQSDIYSLGIVFYELLTGELPYRGETPVEIAMKHIRDDMASVLSFNPSLPHSIANIIAKATCKNKNYRYKMMQDFVEDLMTCLNPDRKNEQLWQVAAKDEEETIVFDRVNNLNKNKKNPMKKTWVILGVSMALLVTVFAVWFITRPQLPTEITMPKITGLSVEEATILVEDLGLYLNPSYQYAYSDEFEQGMISESRPAEGAIVSRGSQIRITISQGLTFLVEDYTDWALADVTQALAAVNVTVYTTRVPTQDREANIVLRQENLVAGERINPTQRREIMLYVTSPVELTIPSSLLGTDIVQAQAQLEDLGIEVTVSELPISSSWSQEYIESLDFGVVTNTSPTPGSFYIQEQGKTLTLYYYNEASKPDFTGGDTNEDSNNN